MNGPDNYFPIIIQAIVALGFVAMVLVLTHLLGPKLRAKNKDSNFECGIESKGDARFPVSVKYFMTAILFVLFDVEVIFFYPYAVNFKELVMASGIKIFLEMLAFIGFFVVGFVYIIKRGALKWE